MIGGSSLPEWYSPPTSPQEQINEALAMGLNTITFSMDRDQILAARGGDNSASQLVALAAQNNIKLHVLTGFQTYFPQGSNGPNLPPTSNSSAWRTGTDSLGGLNAQLLDLDWILKTFPTIGGIELEEPVVTGSMASGRAVLSQWFRDMKALIIKYHTFGAFDFGYNEPSMSYQTVYDSGIDYAVINNEKLFSFMLYQTQASGEVSAVDEWKIRFPALECGVYVYHNQGGVVADLTAALQRSPIVPIMMQEQRDVYAYAAQIRAVVDQYGGTVPPPPPPPTTGTLTINSNPIGASIYLNGVKQ